MALKHPLVAHNYTKNGYYPTDAALVKRINPVLTITQNQIMTLLDPCAGEGTALSVIALGLGKTAKFYIVEYNKQRCDLTAQITDIALRSYFFDTIISLGYFSLLLLNSPYGDLASDHSGYNRYHGERAND